MFEIQLSNNIVTFDHLLILVIYRKRKRSEASLKSKLEFSETGGKSGFSNLTYDNEKADAMFE